jgi:hypothetical protein
MSTNRTNLTLELRSANGSTTEFFETDKERVREALRLLAAPRLFAEPHLLLASQNCASMIPCKGIDMILVRTSAQLPIQFPLELPVGRFDFVEHQYAWPDDRSAPIKEQDGQSRQRNSQLEIHTLGGWTVALKAMAMLQDELQFFSRLSSLPTIPFRLKDGGFGLLNTANIVCVSAWPKPEVIPAFSLPLELRL